MKFNFMKRMVIASVTGVALLLGTSGLASSQEQQRNARQHQRRGTQQWQQEQERQQQRIQQQRLNQYSQQRRQHDRLAQQRGRDCSNNGVSRTCVFSNNIWSACVRTR